MALAQARAQKYLFDQAFDTDEDDPRREVVPTYSQEALDAACAETHAAGVAQGREAEREEATARTALAAEAMVGAMQGFIDAQQAHNDAIMRRVVEVAVAIARKAAPVMIEHGASSEIEALVRECLGNLLDEPRVVVRVNDALVEPLKARIDELAASRGFAGAIVLLGDETMGPADCAVQWPDGGIERNSEQLWAEIDRAVERTMGHWSTGGEGDGAAAEGKDKEA